jgi:hypothetical protein
VARTRVPATNAGANIGNQATVHLSEFFEKVFAFEPNPGKQFRLHAINWPPWTCNIQWFDFRLSDVEW